MSPFEHAIDDDDLGHPEEHSQQDDWGWMSSGAQSWRPVIVAAVLAILVMLLALMG